MVARVRRHGNPREPAPPDPDGAGVPRDRRARGSEAIGGIQFDDHVLAYRIGTIALILILFDGGLSTRFRRVRSHLAPSIVLATFGVLATAALLLAVVVSSTDAAAVFSVLRGSGTSLSLRVSATIELEPHVARRCCACRRPRSGCFRWSPARARRSPTVRRLFCKPEDEPAVALWFGQRIDERA